MKKINKKLWFGVFGATAGFGLLSSAIVACSTNETKNNKPNNDQTQKQPDTTPDTTPENQETPKSTLGLEDFDFVIKTAKNIDEVYATQFTLDNLSLVLKKDQQTYDIAKEGDNYFFRKFDLNINKLEANKQEGEITISFSFGSDQQTFTKVINGFKKQTRLEDLTSFEENTVLSSKFELENNEQFDNKSQTFASTIKKDVILNSILIDDQEILTTKFNTEITGIKSDDAKGELSFLVSISFKDSDSNDKTKSIAKEFTINGFKQKILEPLQDDFLNRLVLVTNLENKKTKLPSEIKENPAKYLTLKLKETKEPDAALVDIDTNIYKWELTSQSIADDNTGHFTIYFNIKFKEDGDVKGRNKELSRSISGFKTVSEIERNNLETYNEEQPWDYNYHAARPTLDASIQKSFDANRLSLLDLIISYKSSAERRRQYYIDEMYRYLFTDTTSKKSFSYKAYDFFNLTKNFEKYYRDNLTSEQKSALLTSWSEMDASKRKEYGDDPMNLWLTLIMKFMPIQVSWSNDPSVVDVTFNGSRTNSSGDTAGTTETSRQDSPLSIRQTKERNNKELFENQQLIYIPAYRYLTESKSNDSSKSEKQLLQEWAEAKTQLDNATNDAQKQKAYNDALEAVKEKFEVSENFIYNPNVEYLVAIHRFDPKLGNQQRKPRLVVRSKVIEKWEQDGKPIMITTNGIRLKSIIVGTTTTFPDLKYLTPKLSDDKLYFNSISYSETTANSTKLRIQLSNPNTLVQGQKLYFEYAKYESAEATTSIPKSTKKIELDYSENGVYETVLSELEPNSFYRLTQIGYKNGTTSEYTNKDKTTKQVPNIFVLNGKDQANHKILLATPASNS